MFCVMKWVIQFFLIGFSKVMGKTKITTFIKCHLICREGPILLLQWNKWKQFYGCFTDKILFWYYCTGFPLGGSFVFFSWTNVTGPVASCAGKNINNNENKSLLYRCLSTMTYCPSCENWIFNISLMFYFMISFDIKNRRIEELRLHFSLQSDISTPQVFRIQKTHPPSKHTRPQPTMLHTVTYSCTINHPLKRGISSRRAGDVW